MRPRLAGLTIGLLFGIVLAWSGMTSPVVIRQALLFQRAYLFLFFAAATLVASAGLWVLRRMRPWALLADARVEWATERPARRHVVGALVFGLGWGSPTHAPVRSSRRWAKASGGACSRWSASSSVCCCSCGSDSPKPSRRPTRRPWSRRRPSPGLSERDRRRASARDHAESSAGGDGTPDGETASSCGRRSEPLLLGEGGPSCGAGGSVRTSRTASIAPSIPSSTEPQRYSAADVPMALASGPTSANPSGASASAPNQS